MTDNISSSNTSHPVFTINNIKNFIPLLLDQEDGNYASWVELFHIHACAYDVLDHIDASVPKPPSVSGPTWKRIDAIVKQWIYGTISKDLLKTIMKPGATAQELWTRLEEIFQDNKHTTITTTILQADPLPSSNNQARSHLLLEETQGAPTTNPTILNAPSSEAGYQHPDNCPPSFSGPRLQEENVDFFKTDRIAPKAPSFASARMRLVGDRFNRLYPTAYNKDKDEN